MLNYLIQHYSRSLELEEELQHAKIKFSTKRTSILQFEKKPKVIFKAVIRTRSLHRSK